jgi:curved DNA-binding protein CbpA
MRIGHETSPIIERPPWPYAVCYTPSVAEAETFVAWADSLDSLDYYRVLRVPSNASPEQIKLAFHELALRTHPDQYVEEGEEVRLAAARVFKRSVEAYGILAKAELRMVYDARLRTGTLRMTPDDKVPEAPKPTRQTFEQIVQTPEAKKLAQKADRLLVIGNTEGARLALIDASRYEPDNDALKSAVRKLYSM